MENTQFFNFMSDVKEFHDKFGLTTPSAFQALPKDLAEFRAKFMVEELDEFVEAVKNNDIEIAIDSIIDSLYIICGTALLHGITNEELISHAMACDDFFSQADTYDAKPSAAECMHLPVDASVKKFHDVYSAIVDKYLLIQTMHASNTDEKLDDLTHRLYTCLLLGSMYRSCLVASSEMGCSDELFMLLWKDVHRANMTKKRAEHPTESKRGSQWDVVKPEGWVGPQTKDLIDAYYATRH